MLELRPTCENCNIPLPPASTEAMICTFECTFCKDCVHTVLENVCPNCGGGFCPRPIRPATARRGELSTTGRPPTSKVTYKPVDRAAHEAFAAAIKAIAPEHR